MAKGITTYIIKCIAGCKYTGYEAASPNFIIHNYGSVRSCYDKCGNTSKCIAFMYRHADSLCWLYNSKKKLKVKALGLEFFDMKCKEGLEKSR